MLAFLRRIIPQSSFLRRGYSALNGFLAAAFNGFPTKNLSIIGVTGTDGKTTTVEMTAFLLRKGGKKVLSISTVGIFFDDEHFQTDKRTTPGPWILQNLLCRAHKKNTEIVVLEVSSHAIAQNRIFGISFDVAVLTTLSPEHLDYHKTMAKYSHTKKKLFSLFRKKEGLAVLNADNTYGHKWKNNLSGKKKMYSVREEKSDVCAKNISISKNGVCFDVEKQKVMLPVCGSFNVGNALAALLAAEFFGIKRQSALLSFAFFPGVLGRMQEVRCGQDFRIFLDFALTPNAVKKVLQSAQKMGEKVIVVLGSAGSHPDTEVRFAIGKVAAENASLVIITDDEPYYENPDLIRKNILDGARTALKEEEYKTQIMNIADREVAISTALQRANTGDVVLILGMGHLKTRNIAGVEQKWSDKTVVEKQFTAVKK